MSRKKHAYRHSLFSVGNPAVKKMGVKDWSDFTPIEQLEAEQALAELLSNFQRAKERGR